MMCCKTASQSGGVVKTAACCVLVGCVALSPHTTFAAPNIKSGYVACLSESALDEFTSAVTSNDERAQRYLMGRSCFRTSSMTSYPITILKPGLMTVKVRIYGEGDTLEIWTYSEAIRK